VSAAQEAKKAGGVFDDEPAASTKAKAKSADAPKGKADDKAAAKPADREAIRFTQENAAAQMAELEERMFRLSEGLRGLEPENASRLRLALKFSREELILEQMREANGLLKEAQLNKAETEVRELLAKLQHLRDLLLAEDLDFQLKLARLRQMRETLGQLERIIKDERRELGWSRFVLEQGKSGERLASRRPALETLVRDQEAVVTDVRGVADAEDGAVADAIASVRRRQADLRNRAVGLAADPLFAGLQPPHLDRAATSMGDAIDGLAKPDSDAATASGRKALDSLREELARADARLAESEKAASSGEFRRHEADQAKVRLAAATLGEMSGRLGDAGVALQKDLIRATASMQGAEGHLAKSAADPAATEEEHALEALAKSRDDLARSVEKLLVELRTELQSKIIAELTEMHESQASVRETTEAQAPRVAQKSRTALIQLGGLSKKETELADRTEHLLGLVEETEYGIALPTALRVLSREMKAIAGRLKDGDAGQRTVALEKRVEEDLIGLLAAIRRLPPTTPPPPGTPLPDDLRERERELNRLVSELKTIRLLQSRLNDDTTRVDGSREGEAALTPALRREVELLESTQDEIRDSLARVAERVDTPDQP
jgi:hypothetical protein